MIKTTELSKHYGEAQVVAGLNLDIQAGEIVGFLGPNGAGKTTTMRLLTTYLRPSSGEATVAGFDVLNEPELVRSRIGYLPETPPLYPEMRISEYLDFAGAIRGLRGQRLRSRKAEVLSLCALEDSSNKLCGQLSKGYKQRVGIAQALIHEPEVIILDEPTSGLDPSQIVEIRKLIKSLAGKHTVVLSTHILPEVQAVCSRVLIIKSGKLVKDAPPEELGSLEEAFLQAAFGAGNSEEALV